MRNEWQTCKVYTDPAELERAVRADFERSNPGEQYFDYSVGECTFSTFNQARAYVSKLVKQTNEVHFINKCAPNDVVAVWRIAPGGKLERFE